MQAWNKFLTLQETELGLETVNKWLRPLKVLRFDACNLYLEAKDSFQVLWFEEHIRQKAQARLLNNNSKRIKVHLSIANVKAPTAIKGKVKKATAQAVNIQIFNLIFDGLYPYSTFQNFVISEANLLPHKLLCKLAGYDSDTYTLVPGKKELCSCNPIYLYGSSGTGKSHLLIATAHALKQQGLNVIYTRAETFTEHVVTAIRAGEMSTFRQTYRNIDALIIDDVHVFSRKGATQEELFHTFNTLHLAGRQIILSANCSPSELQFIQPRLVSRFEWGIVIPLDLLDKVKIAEVLNKRAAALNYTLHPKIAEFLISTFTSNVKALTRALEALILRSHMSQVSGKQTSLMSVALAQQYLSIYSGRTAICFDFGKNYSDRCGTFWDTSRGYIRKSTKPGLRLAAPAFHVSLPQPASHAFYKNR